MNKQVGHATVVQAEMDVCHVKGFMFSLEGFHVFLAIFDGFMVSLVGFHVFPIRARGQRNPSTTKSLLTSRCPRTAVELRRQGLIPSYCVARFIHFLKYCRLEGCIRSQSDERKSAQLPANRRSIA